MVRVLIAILLGAAVTFGLFVVMAALIANTSRPDEDKTAAPVIDIVMTEPDSATQTRTRTPPPPPPPPQQPPKLPPVEPDTSNSNATVSVNLPSLDVGGASVDIGAPGQMMRDGEATPIVRIEPKYPAQAARDGLEGWVKMSFTIDELGGVTDIEVVDAEPKRVFDREARRALSRWKYKPKVVDGKAVKQPGILVQLDFKLEGNN
jgi:protein TonB